MDSKVRYLLDMTLMNTYITTLPFLYMHKVIDWVIKLIVLSRGVAYVYDIFKGT